MSDKSLSELINANTYESEFQTCQGCDNHCTVKLFHFQNGNTFASGNNCEKVYSNHSESERKGVNMMVEKYKLLFRQPKVEPIGKPMGVKIGLPRALGMFEDYPFWYTLFSACGFEVVLSVNSNNKIYESGLRTIMADNICFPAKLMHGHINNLIDLKVDRIFYPYVVYERKEDAKSKNSFNCPIVSAYSDVIKSSMDPANKRGVPFDAPVITFNSDDLLENSCWAYLKTLGVKRDVALRAIQMAKDVQTAYIQKLTDRANEVLELATKENRMVILLAARPYHTDPMIEHKISQAIAYMGIDVITEHVATKLGSSVFEEVNAVSQWAYPNRIFKAAYFAGKYPRKNLHFVELTSFGCGPDAFILDEVNAILKRFGKNLTILKIDDVNNIGSLRLRIRSLVESCKADLAAESKIDRKFETTKIFEKEDRRRTIIAPYFAEGYSEFLPSLFKLAGYNLVVLPTGNQEAAETGLRYANNDICYPATIVVGSIINALKSGKYDLDNTAVIITQTGGQCRASNYYSLIKNAMVAGGFAKVPVLSLATGAGVSNSQPGFEINWLKVAKTLVHAMLYADCIAKMYHSAAVREKIKGKAFELRNHYIEAAFPYVEAKDHKGLKRLLKQAVADFSNAVEKNKQVPVIGLVGEIYVKYNGFSNKFVTQWLIEHGVEVVPPALVTFFSTSFVNSHYNRKYNIKHESGSLLMSDGLHALLLSCMRTYDRICRPFPYYRPFASIFEIGRLSEKVINPAADFGEGWMLPGEICHLAEHGVQNVVSLQPFGCIANHIISKGIEKKIKQVYPQMSLLFLDFDSSTSEANVFNRLHFMVENCKAQMEEESRNKAAAAV
ncbi:MAG: 2-hydroxyacyl-CoA dehydratase [Salinivirgaceae bacterium]|nr:2-hydroxyacyl-CoA dehydratase [Salinivirgaceae bacterium]